MGSQHWNTPPEIVEMLLPFGHICLDPCSNPHSIVGACQEYTEAEDGLKQVWVTCHPSGLLFVNPPYSNVLPWMRYSYRAAGIAQQHVVVLVNAATETGWFDLFGWKRSPAICFLNKRVKFLEAGQRKSSNPHPSALIYFGSEPERFKEVMAPHGFVLCRPELALGRGSDIPYGALPRWATFGGSND